MSNSAFGCKWLCYIAIGMLVSRPGIEPRTSRLRDASTRQSITADPGKSGSAVPPFSCQKPIKIACHGIRCSTLHPAPIDPGCIARASTVACPVRVPHQAPYHRADLA